MKERIAAYLSGPTPEAFAELRRALVESQTYAPDSLDVHRLWQAIETGDDDRALGLVSRVQGNYLLSPLAHTALAALADKTGDRETGRFEQAFAARTRESLLATGDGSLSRPFQVTRVDDEYSILSALRARVQTCRSIFWSGRLLDVHETDKGLLHFEVNGAFEAYGRNS